MLLSVTPLLSLRIGGREDWINGFHLCNQHTWSSVHVPDRLEASGLRIPQAALPPLLSRGWPQPAVQQTSSVALVFVRPHATGGGGLKDPGLRRASSLRNLRPRQPKPLQIVAERHPRGH